ncbi:alpha/beta fold hydrolase [Cupriavidus necator]
MKIEVTRQSTKSEPKSHFVLVHGAWHGAWCWSSVIPLLRAQGHGVTAVDLPGRWREPGELVGLTADDYVRIVEQVLRTVDGPIVLVGHSLGGATISLAAERVPDHVRRLIYLAAFLVPDGQTVGAIAGTDEHSSLSTLVRRDTGVSYVNLERANQVLYHDCSEADTRVAHRPLCFEPSVMGQTPMRVTPERFGRIPRAYIECLQDRAISINAQRAMQAALPCNQVATMDTGHSPFISRPYELAEILLQMR